MAQVGMWRRHYDNGQLIDEGNYEEGKKAGEWNTYDKTGRLKRTTVHKG
jgi:antitoxin component YwqK of YwqJK toxin-antitoxin module